MEIQVKVRDADAMQAARQPLEWVLVFKEERISLRDLIRERVYQEVDAFNLEMGDIFHGLVQPGQAERTLNGFRMPKNKPHFIDREVQYKEALELFEQNGFIVLADDRQIETLDQEIVLKSDSVVTFLKLIPLVGG